MRVHRYSAVMAIVLLLPGSCKKETTGTNNNNNNNDTTLLQKDATVPDNFGLKINFSSYGYPKFNGGHLWTSDSTFLIAAESDIIEADFNKQTLTDIAPKSGGLLLGLTGDKNAVLFVSMSGFYTYGLPRGPINYIGSLSNNESGNAIVFANKILYYKGTRRPQQPCDGFCWPLPGTGLIDAHLFYIDAVTRSKTDLGDLFPVRFSDDGKYAMINSTDWSGQSYILDMNSLHIIDSFPTQTQTDNLIWKDNLLMVNADNTSYPSKIVITNIKTNEVKESYVSETNLIDSKFFLSPDDDMIIYTGPCLDSDCGYAIWALDRITGEQKKIVSGSAGSFQTSPFEEISISPDHKKIVFRYINDLYLKELQ